MASKKVRRVTMSPTQLRLRVLQTQQSVNWAMRAAEQGNCRTALFDIMGLHQGLGNFEVTASPREYDQVEAVVLRGANNVLHRCGIRPSAAERSKGFQYDKVYGGRRDYAAELHLNDRISALE